MKLVDHLKHLEEALLTSTVRNDAAQLNALLADDFREYGSSGRIYTRAEIIQALHAEAPVERSLTGFELALLTEAVALVTYRVVRRVPHAFPAESLRSSIWVFRDHRWQMLFHQGTKIPSMDL